MSVPEINQSRSCCCICGQCYCVHLLWQLGLFFPFYHSSPQSHLNCLSALSLLEEYFTWQYFHKCRYFVFSLFGLDYFSNKEVHELDDAIRFCSLYLGILSLVSQKTLYLIPRYWIITLFTHDICIIQYHGVRCCICTMLQLFENIFLCI